MMKKHVLLFCLSLLSVVSVRASAAQAEHSDRVSIEIVHPRNVSAKFYSTAEKKQSIESYIAPLIEMRSIEVPAELENPLILFRGKQLSHARYTVVNLAPEGVRYRAIPQSLELTNTYYWVGQMLELWSRFGYNYKKHLRVDLNAKRPSGSEEAYEVNCDGEDEDVISIYQNPLTRVLDPSFITSIVNEVLVYSTQGSPLVNQSHEFFEARNLLQNSLIAYVSSTLMGGISAIKKIEMQGNGIAVAGDALLNFLFRFVVGLNQLEHMGIREVDLIAFSALRYSVADDFAMSKDLGYFLKKSAHIILGDHSADDAIHAVFKSMGYDEQLAADDWVPPKNYNDLFSIDARVQLNTEFTQGTKLLKRLAYERDEKNLGHWQLVQAEEAPYWFYYDSTGQLRAAFTKEGKRIRSFMRFFHESKMNDQSIDSFLDLILYSETLSRFENGLQKKINDALESKEQYESYFAELQGLELGMVPDSYGLEHLLMAEKKLNAHLKNIKLKIENKIDQLPYSIFDLREEVPLVVDGRVIQGKVYRFEADTPVIHSAYKNKKTIIESIEVVVVPEERVQGLDSPAFHEHERVVGLSVETSDARHEEVRIEGFDSPFKPECQDYLEDN